MKRFNGLVIAFVCTLPLLWVSCEDLVPSEDMVAPIVMQGTSSNATRTTIMLTGNFEGINKNVKDIGVVYSTSSGFPEDASTTVKIETEFSNTLSVTLTGLNPDTEYFYYWYVSSGNTVVKSNISQFKTESTSAPMFGETSVIMVDENAMTVETSIMEIGNSCLLECGFEYREKVEGARFISLSCEGLPENEDMKYSLQLTNLKANTEYEVRPYAKNAADEEASNGTIEGYGDIIIQKTMDKISPEVETKSVINVGIASATLVGRITNNPVEESEITEKGFCLSKVNRIPTVYDSTLVVKTITEINKDFLYELTELEYNTVYYVRAYAKNIIDGTERVGYGNEMQFTTSQMISPEVVYGYKDETNDVEYTTEVTSSSAKCYATLKNLDLSVLKERGFIWSKDNHNVNLEEARREGNVVIAKGENIMFTATIENLTPNTNYYIRAYAIYESGDITNIGYSPYTSIFTASKAQTEFREIMYYEEESSPTTLSVSSGITDAGDGEVTEYGFIWHYNGDLTLDNCLGHTAMEGKDYSRFNTVIENLIPNQGYYVRAYAKVKFQDEEDVYYSDNKFIETREVIIPQFHSISFDRENMTSSAIPVSVVVQETGDGEITDAGFVWDKNNNVSLQQNLGKQSLTGSDYSKLSCVVKGLDYYTTYFFKAYITISYNGETNTYYSTYNSITTKDIEDVDFYALEMNCTYNSIFVKTRIDLPEKAKLLERGVIWNSGNKDNPTMQAYEGKMVTEAETAIFQDTIKGMKPNTKYTLRPFVRMIYDDMEVSQTGTVFTIYTPNIDSPNFNNFRVVKKAMTSMTVEGTVKNTGMGVIKERGFLWDSSDSYASLDNCDGHIKVDTEEELMQGTINGLLPFTTYYVKMYTISEYEGEEYVHCGVSSYERTLNLTFEPLVCKALSNSAELTVKVDLGVMPEKYDELGFYYTENYNQSFDAIENKILVTPDSNGEYSLKLSNLKTLTKYYWGMYIKFNGVYYTNLKYDFKTTKKPEIGDIESPGTSN